MSSTFPCVRNDPCYRNPYLQKSEVDKLPSASKESSSQYSLIDSSHCLSSSSEEINKLAKPIFCDVLNSTTLDSSSSFFQSNSHIYLGPSSELDSDFKNTRALKVDSSQGEHVEGLRKSSNKRTCVSWSLDLNSILLEAVKQELKGEDFSGLLKKYSKKRKAVFAEVGKNPDLAQFTYAQISKHWDEAVCPLIRKIKPNKRQNEEMQQEIKRVLLQLEAKNREIENGFTTAELVCESYELSGGKFYLDRHDLLDHFQSGKKKKAKRNLGLEPNNASLGQGTSSRNFEIQALNNSKNSESDFFDETLFDS